MNAPSKPRRSRIHLVNRDLQLRYAGAVVVVGVVTTSLTGILILVPLYVFGILRIPVFVPLPFIVSMVVAALVNIAILGYLGIVVTNKIAGPMFSLMRHIRLVEEGYWGGSIRVRAGDEMHDIARNFNGMLSALGDCAKTDIEDVQKIRHDLAQIDHHGTSHPALLRAYAMLDQLSDRASGRLHQDPPRRTMS